MLVRVAVDGAEQVATATVKTFGVGGEGGREVGVERERGVKSNVPCARATKLVTQEAG